MMDIRCFSFDVYFYLRLFGLRCDLALGIKSRWSNVKFLITWTSGSLVESSGKVVHLTDGVKAR